MTVSIEEHHMADGRGTIECDWRPSLYDEFVDDNGNPRKVHALFYDPDGTLTDILVLQDVTPDKDKGITLGLSGLSWWFGSGTNGPLILKREYVSGANKLSDGGFELDTVGLVFINWKTSQDTGWDVRPGEGLFGGIAAFVATDSEKDDVLVSDEDFEVTVGQEYRNTLYVRGGAGLGRIRIRTVFDGRFSPGNLLTGGDFETSADWTETSTVSGNAQIVLGDPVFAHSGDGHLRMYTTQYAPHANGGFETGTLAGWVPVGTWPVSPTTPFTGSWCASSAGGGPTKKFLYADSDPSSPGTADVFPVAPGETWRVQGAIRGGYGGGTPDGRARLICRLYTASSGDAVTLGTDAGTIIAGDVGGPDAPNWTIFSKDFEIPDGVHSICPAAMLEGHTSDSWYFDGIEIVRIRGNRCSMTHTAFWPITPERNYRVRAFIRSDGESMTGQVRPRFTFYDPTGTPLLTTVEGSPQGVSQDWVRYETTASPPSGSAYMTITWIGEDIFGGAFHVDDVDCVDTDSTTYVVDTLSPTFAGAWTPMGHDVTVPAGALKMHTEIVAEAHAAGWYVDEAFVGRIGVTPATHADVVRDLLLDPDTGLPMTVTAGTIDGIFVIPYDWTVLRRIIRDALEHFCRVVASPQMEWRIDSPTRTIDVGIASSVFTDHSPGSGDPLVYTETAIAVTDLPGVTLSSADQVEKVLVVGADRATTSGSTVPVTGMATNATGQLDWNGRSPNRTRLVEDSTVDHGAYADALAADEAARNLNPAKTVTVTLSGTADRGAPPGDWVYAYKPSAGLEDPTYATTIEGRDVFPARKRVVNRVRTLSGTGSSRIDIRRMDGSVFTLPGVNWSLDDSTTLELADVIPVFVSDPQGGNVGRQWLRFRASSPR